jgi:hypothetical protein
MVAARLILAGRMVYAGPKVQVSGRLIETETGRVVAAVNDVFGSSISASEMAERLAGNLLETLERLYPLRGKISKLEGKKVKLNIGEVVGVRNGQRFKMKEVDAVLEVTSTQKDASLANVLQGSELVREGQYIEVEPGS